MPSWPIIQRVHRNQAFSVIFLEELQFSRLIIKPKMQHKNLKTITCSRPNHSPSKDTTFRQIRTGATVPSGSQSTKKSSCRLFVLSANTRSYSPVDSSYTIRRLTTFMYFWIGKIYKTIKEKVFIFILKDFFLICGFASKTVKNGPS
jgi:hypothetical protein